MDTYRDIFDAIVGMGMEKITLSNGDVIIASIEKSLIRPTGRPMLIFLHKEGVRYSIHSLDIKLTNSIHSEIAHGIIREIVEIKLNKLIKEVLNG